mmetsp:Transcript_61031/g.125860  ORF Transcript_61031/g.125860 Transcript_61031/m.125860 type:complete len:225 (-) Transcript_61031:801-1475(-)
MCNPHLGHTLRRVAFGGKRGQKRSVHYRSGMGQHSRSRTTQSLRVGDTTLCWSGKAGSSTRKARDEIYLSICPPRNRQPSNISRSIPRAISSSTTTRHGSTTSVPKAPLPASCTSSGPPESASTATRTISPCTTHALQGEPRTPANIANDVATLVDWMDPDGSSNLPGEPVMELAVDGAAQAPPLRVAFYNRQQGGVLDSWVVVPDPTLTRFAEANQLYSLPSR